MLLIYYPKIFLRINIFIQFTKGTQSQLEWQVLKNIISPTQSHIFDCGVGKYDDIKTVYEAVSSFLPS